MSDSDKFPEIQVINQIICSQLPVSESNSDLKFISFDFDPANPISSEIDFHAIQAQRRVYHIHEIQFSPPFSSIKKKEFFVHFVINHNSENAFGSLLYKKLFDKGKLSF